MNTETVKTTLRIPLSMHQKMKMFCVYKKISLTEFINTMIEQELKKHKEIK